MKLSFHSTHSYFHRLVFKRWRSFHRSREETKVFENTQNTPNLEAAGLKNYLKPRHGTFTRAVLVLIPVTHHIKHFTVWYWRGCCVPPRSWGCPDPFTAPTGCSAGLPHHPTQGSVLLRRRISPWLFFPLRLLGKMDKSQSGKEIIRAQGSLLSKVKNQPQDIS